MDLKRAIFISLISLILSNQLLAQVTNQPIDDVQRAHDERPDDPPVEINPLTLTTSPPMVVTFGDFTSVQVNVDEAGNNIIGDAANEPSIALNPTNHNNLVIGWRQFDTIQSNFRQAGVGHTLDGGKTWNNTGPIEPGIFRSDPVLAADSSGKIFYYSLSTNADFTFFFCDMFNSDDGGATWSDSVPAEGGDKQWMAIDRSGGRGDGFIYAMWNAAFSCCPSGYFTRSIDSGNSFQPSIDTPPPIFWGTMAVGPEGELYICGRSGGNNFVIRSDNAQNGPQTPLFPQQVAVDLNGQNGFFDGPNPAGLLGQYDVEVDCSVGPNRGNVYLLASIDPPGPDPLDVMFSRSADGGATWDDPVRVNSDPTESGRYNWFGTMSLAPCGRIDVIWNDMRDDTDGTMSALYYAFSMDAGVTWSEDQQVAPAFNSLIGFPNQDKIGDYYDLRSTDDAVHIAYSATFNGEQDVYYLRIPQTAGLIGDVNQDGEINLLDVSAFVAVLSEEAYQCEADINQDGEVNLQDVQPFVELLLG